MFVTSSNQAWNKVIKNLDRVLLGNSDCPDCYGGSHKIIMNLKVTSSWILKYHYSQEIGHNENEGE